MNIYVPGKGPANPRIVIVGEAPSFEEEAALEGFVGASGRFLNQMLKDVGINRSECWITNVSKYAVVPQTKYGRKIPFEQRARMANVNLDEQIAELRQELYQLQPNVVIALGAVALHALTGKKPISDYRGSILSGMGQKVIATYHPAHILHQEGDVTGYWQKQVMLFDLMRASKQSNFKEVILPSRSLNVCRNSSDLYDFIQRNKDKDKLSVDIEAKDCIPICVGLAFGTREGITIPLWNTESISTIPDSDMVTIWSMLSGLINREHIKIIGQNFNYDRDKIKRLGFTIRDIYSDTMMKAFTINPELPKNLAFNTSIYTEEPFYKNEGMYEGSINDLLIGCARDACVTYEVDEAMDVDVDEMGLRSFYENWIMKIPDLYSYIEQQGLLVDEDKRKALLQKYVARSEKLNYDLFKITEFPINTQSWQQVAELLYVNWKIIQGSGKTGEEPLTAIINSPRCNPVHKKGIEIILEDRQVKKTIGTYLLTPTDFDGRMRTSYFPCLETGRTSTNQQEPPIRPWVDLVGYNGKKKKVAMGCAFQTITKHGDIGADVREMYIPDDGEIFLQADSAQAEARVVFLLAKDEDALEDIDKHDYHALTASWFFGGTESDYSKKVLGYESPMRFAGKTLRHAGHLGAGKRRASIELNTQARKYKIDYQISELAAGRALDVFHKKQPSIQTVFQAEIIKCLEKNRKLTAPLPFGIKAEKGGIRTFFERWGDELFRQAFSYIPQRAVSDNTKAAAMRIRERAPWIRIMVEAHDALLCSVPIGRELEASLILKEEFERPINFSVCSLERRDLIIPCEVEIGRDYKNLSKFKEAA